MDRTEAVERLSAEGFAALDEGRWRDALRAARQIKPLRHSSWFEIAARALWELGRPQWALNVLESGVARAPQAARLWHWLACLRSDMGDFRGALAAFEREEALPGAAVLGVLYNRAIVHERMGQYAEALALIENVSPAPEEAPPAAYFAELRARLQAALGQYADAVAHADLSLALVEDDTELEARSLAVRSYAHLNLGDDFRAREDLQRAVLLAGDNLPTYLFLVARTLDMQPGAAARYFELYCRGQLTDELAFIVRAEVLADDAEEGLRLVVPFLPEPTRLTMSIDEVIDHGPAGETGWSYAEVEGKWLPMKGVYVIGRFHAFPAQGEEEPP